MSEASSSRILPRIPGVGALLSGRKTGAAASARHREGTLWTSRKATDGPTIVIFADAPYGWLASRIAVQLSASVLVTASGSNPVDIVDSLHPTTAPLSNQSPPPIGVIGVGAASDLAMRAAADPRVSRLALISPTRLAPLPDAAIPPTLLQFTRSGTNSSQIRSLEDHLRASGTAVRATDYLSVSEDWARYPRAARGAQRGLDDLVAFLRRGFGTEATFQVIPGWDLH